MDFELLCPCCNARLKIDPELRAVIAHEAPKAARAFQTVDDAIGALKTHDVEREKKVVLEEIKMVEDTPDDLVFELHNEALWGDHPYGYSILGTRETVSDLPVDAIRELHSRAYHPPQIVVAASGNLEHDELLGALVPR